MNGLKLDDAARMAHRHLAVPTKKGKDDERVLDLPIERQFFDEILRGTKTEEFRDRTDYWKKRLEGRHYDLVRFRAGYQSDSPLSP